MLHILTRKQVKRSILQFSPVQIITLLSYCFLYFVIADVIADMLMGYSLTELLAWLQTLSLVLLKDKSI